jgi:hypothetical protein
MIRTQIYVPVNIHRQLTQEAQKQGFSMAHLVRNFIEAGLQHKKNTDQSGKSAIDALLRMSVKGGPKDLSANLDQYLYGS